MCYSGSGRELVSCPVSMTNGVGAAEKGRSQRVGLFGGCTPGGEFWVPQTWWFRLRSQAGSQYGPDPLGLRRFALVGLQKG